MKKLLNPLGLYAALFVLAFITWLWLGERLKYDFIEGAFFGDASGVRARNFVIPFLFAMFVLPSFTGGLVLGLFRPTVQRVIFTAIALLVFSSSLGFVFISYGFILFVSFGYYAVFLPPICFGAGALTVRMIQRKVHA